MSTTKMLNGAQVIVDYLIQQKARYASACAATAISRNPERAASGHAAAPPRSVMNARRLTR